MTGALFPNRPPRLRMVAVAVTLLAVALTLAVGSIVALWATAAANRRDLHRQDTRMEGLGRQVTALEGQVRGLGEVPVTRTGAPLPGDLAPSTATSASTSPRPTPSATTTTITPPPPPPATTTTTTTTTTSTTLPPCLGGVPIGCVLPNGRVHPHAPTAVAVRSTATTTNGRNP